MAIRLVPKRLIGQTIRGIRTRLGQTEDEFADSLGVASGSTVSKWENGDAQPDYGTLARIAAMGLVDVLVFTETGPAAETPQLTPGEANELRRLLGHMETLMAEAREIVERAADRTAVEVLEAATGRAPARGELELEPSLAVSAEVAVTPRTRKSGGAGKSSTRRGGTRSKTAAEGGARASSSRAGGSKSAARKRASGGKRSSRGSSGAKSGAAESASGAAPSSGAGGGSSTGARGGGRGRSGSKSAPHPAD